MASPRLAVALVLLIGLTGLACSSSPPADDTPEDIDRADDPIADDDYPEELDTPPPHDRHYDVAQIYDAICASCHGDDGDGQGLTEEGFAFDAPEEEWTNSPSVDGILRTLEDGIHDTAMQQFPEFADADRVQLAEHVLDLRHALIED